MFFELVDYTPSYEGRCHQMVLVVGGGNCLIKKAFKTFFFHLFAIHFLSFSQKFQFQFTIFSFQFQYLQIHWVRP